MCLTDWHPDVGNHIDWGIRFWQYGPSQFYDKSQWSVSWPNQPFASMYLFAIIKVLKDLIYNFFWFLNTTIPIFPSKLIFVLEKSLHVWLLKLPFIAADLGLGLLIYRVVKSINPSKALLAASFFLFNPATIYNSTVWGQTDSLINFLTLSGLYLIYQRRYLLGIFLFCFSFAFKLSLIIYLPILAILIFKRISDHRSILIGFSISLIAFILLSLPFSFGHNPIFWIWHNFTTRVINQQGNMLNGNAFNFWFLFYGADLTKSDLTPFLFTSVRLFSRLFTLLVLFPVLLKFFHQKLTIVNLFYVCFLVALTSFLFLSNMHERYLYPIFPLISVLIFTSSTISLSLGLFLTLVHFLNLYNLWFYPDIPILKNILIFQNFALGKIFSLILIGIFIVKLLKYLQRESTN